MNASASARMDRRVAIKWMLTAAAATALLDQVTYAADAPPSNFRNAGGGYGTDPDLLKDYKPGDLWPLTFNDQQRRTAIALCDTIIPADGNSPGAVGVGVPDFIDEWVSAPYPLHAADRAAILAGLAWLDAESARRFGIAYVNLIHRQKNAICDDICFTVTAKPEFKTAAEFFKRYRDLTAGGFYTTREGMKDLGYIGNVPLATFDGPPPEVLQRLGLAPTAGATVARQT